MKMPSKKLKPLAEMVFVDEIVFQYNLAEKAANQLTDFPIGLKSGVLFNLFYSL